MRREPGNEARWSLVTTDAASCFSVYGVSTQVLLISRTTCSVKLLFFKKAAAVIVIVNLGHIKDGEEQREGAYTQDNLKI